jgi:uncharacterized protein with PIN domain
MIDIAGVFLLGVVLYGIFYILTALLVVASKHTSLNKSYITKDYDAYSLPENEEECKVREYMILKQYQELQYKIEPQKQAVRLSKQEYNEYLGSLKWRQKRNERLTLDNHTCQYCGSNLLLREDRETIPNVHHYHYNTLTDENVNTDLVSLCNRCHEFLHANYDLCTMEFLIKQNIANKSK